MARAKTTTPPKDHDKNLVLTLAGCSAIDDAVGATTNMAPFLIVGAGCYFGTEKFMTRSE